MISISGAIGKIEALFDYIVDLEGESTMNEQGPKKRSRDQASVEGHVTFPVTLPNLNESTIKALSEKLDRFQDQVLALQWNYYKMEDTIMASMSVIPQGTQQSIVENECVAMSDSFQESKTTSFENNLQLFVAMAFAAHNSWLKTCHIQLSSNDNGSGIDLKFDLVLDESLASACGAQPLYGALLTIVFAKRVAVDVPATKKAKLNAEALLTPPISITNTPSSSVTTPPFYINLGSPLIPVDTSLEGFFTNLQPPVSDQYLENYVSSAMVARLTPFQTQNVAWMLHREGHIASNAGIVHQIANIKQREFPLLYSGAHLSDTTGNYINLFTSKTTSDKRKIDKLTLRSFRGGILADEMGLGKTVSMLGLISKHTYNTNDSSHPKPADFHDMLFSEATLIIAPGAIMSQWVSEAKSHAPHLKVYQYHGAAKDNISPRELAKYDLVLVYYEVFKNEISHAAPPPDRPRRQAAKYAFKLSPLVSILWFRCVLDEAQMVETTTTKAADMARRIPRWYSWAVTGTPMKSNYKDLFGLYNFLELEQTVSTKVDKFKKFHSELRYKGLFFEFTKATMRRNMKSLLSSQIHIPTQSRHVVRIPFSTIEQHYYEDQSRKCKYELRLDWMDSIGWELPEGASDAMKENFYNARLKMRSWLLALRQNCIHPAIIANNTFRLGYQPNNALPSNSHRKIPSMTEVLNDMAKEAKDRYDNNQHALYTTKLKHGGMFEILQEWENALSIYLKAIPQIETLVQLHTQEVKNMQQHRGIIETTAATSEQKKEEIGEKLTVSVNVLHRWHSLLHQYYFFIAGVYHTLNMENEETLYYNKASDLRRILLEKQIAKTDVSLTELEKSSTRVKPSEEYHVGTREFDEDLLKCREYAGDHDIEYGETSEEQQDINMINNLKRIGEVLDRQFEKMLYLRSKMIKLFTKKLMDSSDGQEDATGEEYDVSLGDQELGQVYITAFQALLQDRKFIIKGNLGPITDIINSNDNGEYISEEAKRIENIENNFRKSLKEPGFTIECLKDVEMFLKSLKYGLMSHGADEVYNVLITNLDWLKSQLLIQSKLVDDLDVDVKRLTALFNNRVAYYKSLQIISDTLLAWKHNNPKNEIKRLTTAEEKLDEMIVHSKSRDSYFKALVEEQKKLEGKSQKDCLICQEAFEKGMITYCGHTSCLDCGLHWFKTSRRCHTCNSTVKPNEWYNVSYRQMMMHDKDSEKPIASGNNTAGLSATTANSLQLTQLIERINTQTIIEGQGAKLDSIIRHIKYIKSANNGKCVVFSQWNKVLGMLSQGLKANEIGSITLSQGANQNAVAKFKEDPNINVILLHARSQSSGLTLVSARTVFIVEPVFNESLEKQAINRVHRIGQTQQTSVFWYIVQDTIEERIQEIHNIKRDRNSQSTIGDVGEQLTLQKLADGGGEFVTDDDLRRCFTSNEAYALS